MKFELNNNSKVVVLIYADFQAFPPTLNLINALKDKVKTIDLIYRPSITDIDIFGSKVKMHKVGAKYNLHAQMNGSAFIKAFLYFLFIYKIIYVLFSKKSNLVIVYDPVALALFRCANLFTIKKSKIWYHNHDVLEPSKTFFSTSYWVSKIETSSFKMLDVFTLPSIEREKYFPLDKLKGEYFFLPNFPSKKLYQKFYNNRKLNSSNKFHIIFQGSIGEGHGLEEIMNILGYNSEVGKDIYLNLKGPISDSYKKILLQNAVELNVVDFLIFHGYTTYLEVPKLASNCHMGVAIFTKTDIMNSTLGSSSNKIYEYAAVGIPIVYLNNQHFNSYLSNEKWAFSTDLTIKNLINIIVEIDDDFIKLSKSANDAFLKKYNFEKFLDDIVNIY